MQPCIRYAEEKNCFLNLETDLAPSQFLSFIESLNSPSRIVAKQNIRANCLFPGNVVVEGGLWNRKMQEPPTKIKMYLEGATTVTGSNITVDAGQTRCYY